MADKSLASRIGHLLSIKSIVTLILTGAFAGMAVAGKIESESLVNIFAVVIAFYFGTQSSSRA